MIIMHVISVLIGAAFPYLLSKTATEIICVVLFFGFGVFMVYQAIFDADDDVSLPHLTLKDRDKEREEIVEKLQEVSRSMEGIKLPSLCF
jgi:putative Ca2+/H+ antiporter (TMEM165/GDT1 family)